CARDLTSPW
nr:immunoglobulin heavy chain junction region [Homo sapiens]